GAARATEAAAAARRPRGWGGNAGGVVRREANGDERPPWPPDRSFGRWPRDRRGADDDGRRPAGRARRRARHALPPEGRLSTATADPVELVILANRIDGVTREMTNTLVRTARSATLLARDFSCSVATSEHELLAAPEGVPCHVFGCGPMCESMAEL